MHGKHLIIFPVGQNRHIMIPKLGADEEGLNSTNNQKKESG